VFSKIDFAVFEGNAFVKKHLFFGFNTVPGRIPGQFAVGSYYSMTGDNGGKGVGFHKKSNRPGGLGVARQFGNLAIGGHFSPGDLFGEGIDFVSKGHEYIVSAKSREPETQQK
jgi:hypothetical protein